MQLRLIDCPPSTTPDRSYQPGDCWYARGGPACTTCGCQWREHPDGSWSLYDDEQTPAECCDNVPMTLAPVWFWWAEPSKRQVKPATSQYPEIAPEHTGKRPMIVVLPTGVAFCLHSPTYADGEPGKSGWKVTGELPKVTVQPSIDYGDPELHFHWHGFLKNGAFTP